MTISVSLHPWQRSCSFLVTKFAHCKRCEMMVVLKHTTNLNPTEEVATFNLHQLSDIYSYPITKSKGKSSYMFKKSLFINVTRFFEMKTNLVVAFTPLEHIQLLGRSRCMILSGLKKHFSLCHLVNLICVGWKWVQITYKNEGKGNFSNFTTGVYMYCFSH